MKRNQDITQLAYEIMVDLSENRLPLHNILLKASRLSTLLNIPNNVNLFQEWAKEAELSVFTIATFNNSILAAQDRDVSISIANPNQYFYPSTVGNTMERTSLRQQANKMLENVARYRAQTYTFAMNTYQKWQFGNIAESIFEKKRSKADIELQKMFPDIQQRLNSIEQNLNSDNTEDWKNAVSSCRTLISDFADIIAPASSVSDKNKYINRLKDFVATKEESETRQKLLGSFIEELKNRIEFTTELTQGSAHQIRPTHNYAEDVVLMTYLLIADLIEILKANQELQNKDKGEKKTKLKKK